MNEKVSSSRLMGGFLVAWTLLNLVQAGMTELFHDEAYYWIYSRDLSWGYYDHAPMVALFIRLGTSLLPGELGVRFLMAIASTLTLLFLWLCTDRKHPVLFMGITMPMVLVQVGGFFAAPDTCLLLFSSMFFWAFQRYLRRDRLQEGILLALFAALMLYSKYHGLMVLFFCTIGNFNLLIRRRSFWMILPGVIVLYLPHILWAYEQGFASLVFHLTERSPQPYRIQDTLDYLAGEWALAGPFTSLILFFAAFSYKSSGPFERAMKFCLIGIFGFLFFLSFNGRVEANWAATAFIPLILLAYLSLSHKESLQRWLYRLAIPGILIVLLLRVYLVWDFMPELRKFRNEFHGWDDWAQQIEAIAGDTPVLFKDSYQLASKYAFYSGQTGYSFNSVAYRNNQFDLGTTEESLQGKKILFVTSDRSYIPTTFDSLVTAKGDHFYYHFQENFHSYQKLSLEVLKENLHFPAGTEVEIPFRLTNPYPYRIDFGQHPAEKVHVTFRLIQKGKTLTSMQLSPPLGPLSFEDSYDFSVLFPVPATPGTYSLQFSLQVGWLPPGRQGSMVRLEVE